MRAMEIGIGRDREEMKTSEEEDALK